MADTVRKGDTGALVRTVQERLTAHGYPATVDGVFGSGTEATLMRFQRAKGLGDDGVVGPKTLAALLAAPTGPVAPPGPLPDMLRRLQTMPGFKVVWRADNHLQLVAVRNLTGRPNYFDDWLVAHWTERGLWHSVQWPITTMPGFYWMENPSNAAGTGAIAEGQYEAWQIGPHGDSGYEALVQRAGAIDCYRDNDRNRVFNLDPNSIQRNQYVGANIHRARTGGVTVAVDRWSAMCLVHARDDGFDEMMRLARTQVDRTAIKTFNVTLIRSDVLGALRAA